MLFHNLKLDKLIERERARPSGRFSSRLGGRNFWIYFSQLPSTLTVSRGVVWTVRCSCSGAHCLISQSRTVCEHCLRIRRVMWRLIGRHHALYGNLKEMRNTMCFVRPVVIAHSEHLYVNFDKQVCWAALNTIKNTNLLWFLRTMVFANNDFCLIIFT